MPGGDASPKPRLLREELDDDPAIAEGQVDQLEASAPQTSNDVRTACELICGSPGRAGVRAKATPMRPRLPGACPRTSLWTVDGPAERCGHAAGCGTSMTRSCSIAVKSSGLQVYSGRSFATATAAVIASYDRVAGLCPARRSADAT